MALQAQQIVALATQAAHAPGFTAQAGQLLNVILADFADTEDLELMVISNIVNLTVATGKGPYTLPVTYRRATFGGVYYGTDNAVQGLARDEFNALNPAATPGPPQNWWADLSPLGQYPAVAPNLYVWPKPDQNYTLTVNAYEVIADIPTPETSVVIPWFPNQRYLITRLAAMLMDITDDERAERFHERADIQLKRYLRYANDDENHVKTAARDARRSDTGI